MKINRIAVRCRKHFAVSCLLNACKRPVQSDVKLASTPYRNQSMKKARTKQRHVHRRRKDNFSQNAHCNERNSLTRPDSVPRIVRKRSFDIPLTKFSLD